MADFKTIRQTAKLGIISEHHLRLMVSQNRCPGIYAGNKFLVNVGALTDLLELESRRCIQCSAPNSSDISYGGDVAQ